MLFGIRMAVLDELKEKKVSGIDEFLDYFLRLWKNDEISLQTHTFKIHIFLLSLFSSFLSPLLISLWPFFRFSSVAFLIKLKIVLTFSELRRRF